MWKFDLTNDAKEGVYKILSYCLNIVNLFGSRPQLIQKHVGYLVSKKLDKDEF